MDNPILTRILDAFIPVFTVVATLFAGAITVLGAKAVTLLKWNVLSDMAKRATKSVDQTDPNAPGEEKARLAQERLAGFAKFAGITNSEPIQTALNEGHVIDLPSVKPCEPTEPTPTMDTSLPPTMGPHAYP
jgi:hypothetical protein